MPRVSLENYDSETLERSPYAGLSKYTKNFLRSLLATDCADQFVFDLSQVLRMKISINLVLAWCNGHIKPSQQAKNLLSYFGYRAQIKAPNLKKSAIIFLEEWHPAWRTEYLRRTRKAIYLPKQT